MSHKQPCCVFSSVHALLLVWRWKLPSTQSPFTKKGFSTCLTMLLQLPQTRHSLPQDRLQHELLDLPMSGVSQDNRMRGGEPVHLFYQSRLRRCAQTASWTESLATLLLMNLSLLLHVFPPGTLSLASFQMYDPLGLYIWMSCTCSSLCY